MVEDVLHCLLSLFEGLAVNEDDLADRAFALGVIEGWAAQVGENELSPGISELADALRDQV